MPALAGPFPVKSGAGGWLDGFDGDGGAVGGDLGHDVADLVAVEPHRDDRVSAPGAGLAPHPLPGLVTAISQQPGVPGDLPAGQRAQLRAHIAEGVAGPNNQPEHIPVDLGDPVARYLVGGDNQHRLGVAGLLLLRLAGGELQPMTGHTCGQLTKSRRGRIVAGAVTLVGGLAPDANPGLTAPLQ